MFFFDCCSQQSTGAGVLAEGRFLQNDMSNQGGQSPTCNAIGFSDTCCLTLTMLTMPFMLTFFLIIRCKPCLALLSALMLALAIFCASLHLDPSPALWHASLPRRPAPCP